LGDAREGEADNVEVATLDARNEPAAETLNGVCAGFVVRLLGSEIPGDVAGSEGREMDERGFHKVAALGIGEADERNSGYYRVRAAGERFEHAAGVVGVAGLAKDAAVERDDRVGSNNDSWTHRAGNDEFSFGVGETLDEFVRRFIRIWSFIDCGGHDVERDSGIAENFGAAG
jgi:hypothetical protein